MSSISQLISSLSDLVVLDEDCHPLVVHVHPGAPEESLSKRERSVGVPLPVSYRELMALSNGMSLLGLYIMPIEEQVWYEDEGILSFHNWGNGDFDCIVLSGQRFPRGAIVFMNHTPEVTVNIEDSLIAWMSRVAEEIQRRGTLLHPMDYRTQRQRGVQGRPTGRLPRRDLPPDFAEELLDLGDFALVDEVAVVGLAVGDLVADGVSMSPLRPRRGRRSGRGPSRAS
jgi:hypothetical protein